MQSRIHKKRLALLSAAILTIGAVANGAPIESAYATGLTTVNQTQSLSSGVFLLSAATTAGSQRTALLTLQSTGAGIPRRFYINALGAGRTITSFTVTVSAVAGLSMTNLQHCKTNAGLSSFGVCSDGSTAINDGNALATPKTISLQISGGDFVSFLCSFSATGLANVNVSYSTADLIPTVTNE